MKEIENKKYKTREESDCHYLEIVEPPAVARGEQTHGGVKGRCTSHAVKRTSSPISKRRNKRRQNRAHTRIYALLCVSRESAISSA